MIMTDILSGWFCHIRLRMSKISIRFFNDGDARAIWDDVTNAWFFSVLDVVGVLNNKGKTVMHKEIGKQSATIF